VVLAFLRRYPYMRVDLVTEGRLVDIVAEGFDLGIRPVDLVPRVMIALPSIARLRHAVVASPNSRAAHFAARSPADFDPAQRIRVRLPNGMLLRWPFEANGEPAPVDAKGRLTVDAPAITRAAVLDGAGVGYFIEADVAEDVAAGRMVPLLEDCTPPRPGFSLCYLGRRNPSAGFTALLAMAREGGARLDRSQCGRRSVDHA
jgi:DNA-binding transcriptional LysR family regulator